MLSHQLTGALRQSAFLVDAEAILVDMTSHGASELRQARLLRNDCGRLAVGDTASTERLRRIIRSLAATGADGSRVSFVLPAGCGRPALILLSHLPGNEGMKESGGRVLCHLLTTGPREAISEADLAAMFGLTPAESRIARAILDGASLPLTARQLAVSLTTARTHLQRVFDKTGTRRQSELIRLLCCFDIPPEAGAARAAI